MSGSIQDVQPVTDLIGADYGLVYKYRRGPALTALAFPTLAFCVFAGIIVDKGLFSFSEFLLTLKFLAPPNIVGLGALVIWLGRYANPALKVMSKRGYALYAEDGALHFFGEVFLISQIEGCRTENGVFQNDIQLISNGKVVASGSRIFIEPA